MKQVLSIIIIAVILSSVTSCKKGGLNIFSIEDDKNFGLQMETEIANSPEYKLLSSTSYPDAYAYLENLKQQILSGGQIEHKDDFAWKLYIVQNDTIQKQHLGIIHLAFGVDTIEEVEEKAKQLKAAGFPILSGPRKTGDGYYEFETLDPDNNRIEVTAVYSPNV